MSVQFSLWFDFPMYLFAVGFRDKFALFFDAIHDICDQGKRGIMLFKIIGLLQNTNPI